MLVPKLCAGRKVQCGEAVLTILEIVGNEVRVGFDAPRHVLVCRHEVLSDRQQAKTHLALYQERRKRAA